MDQSHIDFYTQNGYYVHGPLLDEATLGLCDKPMTR